MAQLKKGKTTASKKSTPAKKTPGTTSQVMRKHNKWHISDESSSNNDSNSSPDAPSHPKWKPHKQKKHVDPEVYEVEESVTEPEHIEEEEWSSDEPEEGNDEAKSDHESDLDDHHCIEAPPELNMKKSATKDLLTIFSDLITVHFTRGSITETMLTIV
ncbi:hypothetical protein B0F90DRAFT_1827129 [Multifurca ochricompacta]|uniref:Uncharacterized protein n=1 Tax=Multifurca ochricompacta TaxID=376703 RepID=A0AAD4LVB1_9AGAM|nr:hypothetical protein B0F90DRAFT_1827129 [Multifurca ochricompacta]